MFFQSPNFSFKSILNGHILEHNLRKLKKVDFQWEPPYDGSIFNRSIVVAKPSNPCTASVVMCK